MTIFVAFCRIACKILIHRSLTIKKNKFTSMSKLDINPVEDFNWDEFESGSAVETGSRSELEKAYEASLGNVAQGEIIKGRISQMTKREVMINVNGKSEGVVSANEFRYNRDLKVGDEVEVLVESCEDKNGQLVLSHKLARSSRAWDRVVSAFDNEEVVEGYIKSRTRGGMIVDIFGLDAFLPGSQIDVRQIRDFDAYVDKTMEFKIVKVNHDFKNVVVSHKVLLEAKLEEQKKAIIEKLERGQVLEGIVKNITGYGVFIDLGGIDGLIHITDLSWSRINNPSDVVELDQKIQVVILDFDAESQRIALGLKQLTPHPWASLDESMKVGDTVKGKVVVLTDYGAFIEVTPGVEGLVHVSEMSWTQHLRSAQDFLKVGQEVEAIILTLDKEERKMSLGLKQLTEDPWANIETRFPVGSQHTARVRNFTQFGIFVELAEGIDGLVHISDLSWDKKIKHPAEFTQVGAELKIQVLEIDIENRRLSLGHKQTEDNPWDGYEAIYRAGTVHKGTVTAVLEKGTIIDLEHGGEAFVASKQAVKEDGTPAQLGETLEFKISEFNRDDRRIYASHSRVYQDQKRAANQTAGEERKNAAKEASEIIAKTNSEASSATLGDLDVWSDLKENM